MKAAATFRAASASDPGLQRHVNEDRVYIDEELGVFLVADGLGGHAAGEHAADIAVREISARLSPRDSRDLDREIRLAITAANNRIYQAAQANPEWRGMACVLTLAVIQDDQVTVGHVGDSRLYLFKDRVLRKLTADHSPVGELEDRGELTEQQAMHHPRRNEIFRDVGSTLRSPYDDRFIDTRSFAFPHEAALLLCSDGLTDVVTSSSIVGILEKYNGEPRRTALQLVEAANQGGGKDNISVILIAGPEFVGRPPALTPPAHARHEITRMRSTRSHWPAWMRPGFTASRRQNWLRSALWLVLGLLLGASIALAVAWWQRAAWMPKVQPPPAPQRIAVDSSDSLAIVKALSIARPGDTITVPKGQFLGPLVLKEGVTVEGLQPGEAVVRSDPNSSIYSGVAIVASGIQHALVRGLSVSGDDSHPLRVGMLIENASVEADELDISGAIQAGVEITGNSHPLLLADFLHANSGPGVVIRDHSRPRLAGNTITGNGASPDASRPGLDVSPTAEPVLVNNDISDNGADLKEAHGFKSRAKTK